MDSGLTSYHDALEALFARTGATSKFGLDRTLAFLEQLGNPHEKITTIHVAGTNGKGSVVATLYALLRAKRLSVGRYMSPHLIDFRERIVVDDKAIEEEYLLAFLRRWGPVAEKMGATFFEITSAMAFDYFASRGVDVAVIETGLGGRLDSTNVIHPIVAGVTSISLDHQEYLGETEEEIAREKAGIFKPGIPSVIGEMSTAARVEIYRVAAEANVAAVVDATRLYKVSEVVLSTEGTTFTIAHAAGSNRLTTGLVGAAQAGNATVALSMLRAVGPPWSVTLDEAAAVLPEVRLAGRFQRVGNFILDVAHNPDGMRSFISTLTEVKPPAPLTAIVGILNDKDWPRMLTLVATAADRIVLVAPPSAPPQRAWNPAEALSFAKANAITAEHDPDFEHAVNAASENGETTLITGSFHTVGDALKILGQNTL
ncbi:MAG: folylpolyglutamate synthase/dihydrofolate synthase family protein [Gemmatimonadaceae bacterium]